MPGKVIRLCDYERRSRNPDAVSPRDPADAAQIIILPVFVPHDQKMSKLPPIPARKRKK